MKRKLLFANVVLVVVVAAAFLHLRREWTESRANEQSVLTRRVPPAPAPPVSPLPAAAPARAAGYNDIAQKMLVSKDRNPVVVVEPPPPPPAAKMPPLPLFHGVVNFGDGPMAIMSENAKAPHRDYQPGDEIGPFKLVALNDDELTLEWDGQTITKKFDEILYRGQPPQSAASPTPTAATPAAAPPPPVTKAAAAPGGDLSPGMKACQPGDTSPAGTVADGMRKVIRSSPFGSRCYWEADK